MANNNLNNSTNKFSEIDKKLMRMAISLAQKAKGFTSPNPVVGAVIVKGDKIISKGYHKKAGRAHAEIEAINACKNKADLRGSIMYVSLEPCTVSGKTPPCVDEIIKYKFSEVIIGSNDLNPEVNGNGIKTLKKAGIKVRTGLFENEVKIQNEIFFKHITSASPFVCCKIASSIDGKIATRYSDSKWITSLESRKKVQKIRMEYDCIMTGINTILIDDPLLYPRKNPGNEKGRIKKQYYRAILDSELKLPHDSNIIRTSDVIKTIVYTANNIPKDDYDYKSSFLSGKNIDTIRVKTYKSESGKTIFLDLKEILKSLYSVYGITSILLETGPTLVTEFLKNNLIDKFIFFLAPKIIGGDSKFNMFSTLNTDKVNDALKIKFKTVKKVIASGKDSDDTDIIVVAYPSTETDY